MSPWDERPGTSRRSRASATAARRPAARARARDAAIDLDAEVVELAASLGLDREELESLEPAAVQQVTDPDALVGRFRVLRQARDVMPFWAGAVLTPIVAGLGQPAVAIVLGVVVVLGWVVHARRRAAVFEIDQAGRWEFRHHGTVCWPEVTEVTFRFRYPWLAPQAGVERAAGETARLRIHRRDGPPIRLPHGQLFQVAPQRRPISYAHLSRGLKTEARAAGMRVERIADTPGAWRAYRR